LTSVTQIPKVVAAKFLSLSAQTHFLVKLIIIYPVLPFRLMLRHFEPLNSLKGTFVQEILILGCIVVPYMNPPKDGTKIHYYHHFSGSL